MDATLVKRLVLVLMHTHTGVDAYLRSRRFIISAIMKARKISLNLSSSFISTWASVIALKYFSGGMRTVSTGCTTPLLTMLSWSLESTEEALFNRRVWFYIKES